MAHIPKEYYSWEQFEVDVQKIATWAHAQRFTHLYGIPRGGLVLAVKLSYLLQIPVTLSQSNITKDTLVVDDIVDSGGTTERLFASVGTVRLASLFYNPESRVKPDFFIREKKQWVVFPWETDESSRYDGTV